ncbi:MAG: hypothetical protein JFAIHJKO_00084 [Pyrinomonadaceae bacterium]|nr:hypothetical protein [Pyrinomonadaceae bacterium]
MFIEPRRIIFFLERVKRATELVGGIAASENGVGDRFYKYSAPTESGTTPPLTCVLRTRRIRARTKTAQSAEAAGTPRSGTKRCSTVVEDSNRVRRQAICAFCAFCINSCVLCIFIQFVQSVLQMDRVVGYAR